MTFQWAKNYSNLHLLCRLCGRYELDEPDSYCYRIIAEDLTQQGPQCGLVALAMCADKPTREMVAEIMDYAQKEQMTNLGEMFSVDYMCSLAIKFLSRQVEVYAGSLMNQQIIDFLYTGGMILVPYDCDKNHTPTKKNGSSAHWALVCGIVESYAGTFIIAKQGKSLNVHVWSLVDLAESNQQLKEYANEKTELGMKYIMPEGGPAGLNGLCNRSVLIYPKDTDTLYKS